MKINKLKLFSFLGLSIFLTNILSILNINFLYLQTIISFVTILLIPGIFIFMAFKIKNISFWETLLLVIGFSISFLEFGGLLINFLFPLFKIAKPLSEYPLLAGFDSYFVILAILAWKRNKIISIQIPKLNFSIQKLAFYLVPVLFPILSVFGAIRLNNGASNILTMVMLLGIGIYVLALTLFRNKISPSIFPYSLYMIAVSALLMTSLRSWHITGHDIQREYYVFQLTKMHQLWSMDFYRDAYNACLSITILPTVLFNFLKISDVYIYKLIFQILFAFSPIAIYLFLKRYSSAFISFVAAFFYISFPTFFNDMPMLNRQEIGFIFFGILLLISFSSSIPINIRRILFVIFGFSIIVSHYSTNYVVLFIFGLTYLISFLMKIPHIKKRGNKLISKLSSNIKKNIIEDKFLTVFLIIALFAFTYVWNSQVTKTSGNVGSVIVQSIEGIFIHSDEDKRSGDLAYSFFFPHKTNPQQILDNYINTTVAQARSGNEHPDFYAKSQYTKYKTVPLDLHVLPQTQIGKIITSLHFPLFEIQSLSRQISAQLMQVLVPLGLIGFFYIKAKKKYHKKYIILCFSSLVLLMLEIALPTLSVDYGLLRMFQQLLMILSLPMVIAILMLATPFKRVSPLFIAGLVSVVFFLILTGFFANLTGDYYPQLNLNNSGLYYDAYYTREQNLTSVAWLAQNRNKKVEVQADNSGVGALMIYGNIPALREIFPPIIRRDSYVYLTNANLTNAIVSIETNTLIFTSPVNFVGNYKNLIYNDGSNRIYK